MAIAQTITSAWAVKNRSKIFVNDASYQAEMPMAGRKDALHILDSVIRQEIETRCVVISDHLGAGKSFLMKNAIRELVNKKQLEEDRDITWLCLDEITDGSKIKQARSRVLIVDDVDRKADAANVESAIRQVTDWLDHDRVAIVIGDYTVRNLQLVAPIAGKEAITYVPLEPLERPLLEKALTDRMAHQLGVELGRPDAAADITAEVQTQVATMFADDVLFSLLPPTDPPVANFRDVLGIVRTMAENLPLTSDPCVFTTNAYRKWKRRKKIEGTDDVQREFVEALHEMIRERARRRESWTPLRTEEWMRVANVKGDPEEFRREALEPLALAQVLLPMGMPYSTKEHVKFPSPYLPTITTFMAALLWETTS